MRQSVRVVGLAITIATIILIAFVATMVYSLYMTVATGEAIGFGDPTYTLSDGAITMAIPLYINNTGLYDMTDINVTTVVIVVPLSRDGGVRQPVEVASATTVIPLVRRGSTAETAHELTIDLTEMLERNLTFLLFEEAEMYTNVAMSFTYAKAMTFSVSAEGIEVPWGPPLYGLNVSDLTVELEDAVPVAKVWVGFENRSPMDLSGALTVELRNAHGNVVSSGTVELEAPSWTAWTGTVSMPVEDPSLITPEGEVWLYVSVGGVTVGPVVIPYSGLVWWWP